MMSSWSALPDAVIEATGRASEQFLQSGCATYSSAAKYVCELPYGRNSDGADYLLVLREARGTCSTKHALLAALARERDLPVELALGIYDMSEANTPGVGRVLSSHGLESIPEAHCYLRYRDLRVDVTRCGPPPEAPISRLLREWTIEPDQIGEHKRRLHRAYLRQWLAQHPEIPLSMDALWGAREACIAALSGAADMAAPP